MKNSFRFPKNKINEIHYKVQHLVTSEHLTETEMQTQQGLKKQEA